MSAPRQNSLKGALTRRLVTGLLLLGVVGALSAYALGTRFANRAFDRSLFDDVQVLANQVRWVEGGTAITLSPDALIWLLADEGDNVIFRVTDLSNDHLLASNGDLGPLPDLHIRDNDPYFRSIDIGHDRLRVAYVKRPVGPGQAAALVEIGETTRKREDIAASILLGTVSMMSVFIFVAVGLVWTGVGMALTPLRTLEADAAKRTIDDMQPLDPGSAPAEVRRLIDAFNDMMRRVARAIEVQRHFLANAAHQLKTPVAGLRLQAQLALTATSLETAQANMRSVEQRAEYSARLIDQLLLLAQAEGADAVLQSSEVELDQLAHNVIERMLPAANLRGVDLGFETVGDGPRLSANPVMMGELMTNLVDNAVRYGRKGGRVTVHIERRDTALFLRVSDDGEGFPEAARDLVFRRFWRADSSSGSGAGLGLAIVKEIADRYGATVSIASRPAVDGTQVEVRFPVTAGSGRPAAAS